MKGQNPDQETDVQTNKEICRLLALAPLFVKNEISAKAKAH